MSKYIKLNDALEGECIYEDCEKCPLYKEEKQCKLGEWLYSMTVIEVSEDCISREWVYNELNKVTAETLTEKVMITEFYRIINDAQSVVPMKG